MSSKQTNLLLLTLLMWNPLMLLLLSRSMLVSFTVLSSLLIAAYGVSKSQSFRVKVWAFNIGALISISCHGELLFREFLPDKSIPNLYELHGKYYFNKPFLDREFRTDEYVSRYKTNCQGYRMDDLSNASDSLKSCDWLFIGDSFTQGAQVNYDELYTTQLYKRFPDKIIINAGISGAGLYDELNYFRDKGKYLSPKVVFLQIGVFNDFFNLKERRATFQDYLLEKSDLYRYIAYNVFSTDSLPLGRWTEPFFPTKELNEDYNILYKGCSPVKRADIQAFKDCLSQWKHEVEAGGGKLVLFLIPAKEQVSPQLLKEVTDRYNISVSDLDMSFPNRLFHDTADQLGLACYDMTKAFQESATFPFFPYDEHLCVHGHDRIAKELGSFLKSQASEVVYQSLGNNHDRYPSISKVDSSLLFQSQDADRYRICLRYPNSQENKTVITSFEELVHPTFSPDMRYLAYTEGNQETSQTDVILYDNASNTYTKLNKEDSFAAIPAFNHAGTIVAFPTWDKTSSPVANIVLFHLETSTIIDRITSNAECWRPLFSLDDKSIFYIQKEKHFIIQQYDMEQKSVTNILSLPFDIWDIALSPSGKYLVFAGNKDGNWDLFRFTLATKEVEQLTLSLGDEWDLAFGLTDSDLWYAGVFGFNEGIFYRRMGL